MKLQKSFGKLKRRRFLTLRQVAGYSMSPAYIPGQILVLWGLFKDVQVGDVIVFEHDGKEKIKRIKHTDPLKGVFVVGDNPQASTDSRTFGWIPFLCITGKVMWPRR